LSFADEDVLAYNTATGAWSMVLDGSDIGLSGNSAGDVDAFAFHPDGSILLSVLGPTTLPAVGSVDDSDIIRFIPASLGSTTAGTFEWYFDGSDVGLTANGEDVDAVHLLADGDLLISTASTFSVSGVSGENEDLIRFTPTSLGTTTAGSWAMYLDGSDVGLSASDEDVWGVWADETAGDLKLTTRGQYTVSGAAGDGADIFVCDPGSLGSSTSCTFSPFWDGAASGFGGERMDAVAISAGG
jgi:hypothetical protein